MRPEERLQGLGLSLPSVAAPAGDYVPALVDGSTVWTSGQLPTVEGRLVATGLVGDADGQVSAETARECARIAALNGLAAMADVCGGLDRILRVVRVVGYVASASGFTGQASVVNGASDLMADVFGDSGRHVRSAIGAAALPLGSPVEIEIEARLR